MVPTPLPARPNLEQLKKQAKALWKGLEAGDPRALERLRAHHPAALRKSKLTLADGQLILAVEHGFSSWAKLKTHIAALADAPIGELVERLRKAAGRGDLAELRTLLDEHPELVNEPGGPGVRTALHQTVFGNQVEAARLLLSRGADPNIRCEGDNAMPLHFAAEKQLFPLIRLLIEHGADPIGADDYHELEVIGWATAWDYIQADPEIVDYLLAHGARHNIYSAVAMGDVDAIRRVAAETPVMLEKRMEGASDRRRPMHLAVIKKQRRSLATLLELGANQEALDDAGLTPLDEAALRGEREMAEMLLSHGAKVRLPAAVALRRKADVERILRRDPEILKPGNRWGTLIVRAAERASGEVIEALIQAGADVNVRDDPKTAVDSTSGYTPLHAAGFRGNLPAAAVLLKHGANVTVRDEKYRGTPAGWASYAGHKAVHELILKGPVDIMEALENGLTERVREILAADPEALNRPYSAYPAYPMYVEGWYTPLAAAALQGRAEMVQLLLDLGANAAVRSPEGRSLSELAGGEIGEMLGG